MSRKKIVAATMIAAALGLAFAGYTATRANGTDDVPEHLRPSPLKADAGYRQNHQIGHDGAVFEWMDAAASLTHSPNSDSSFAQVPISQREPAAFAAEADELTPVEIEHVTRIGPDTFAGLGLAGGGGAGGTPKAGDDWGGARYVGSFGGIGGFGGFYGAGGGGGGGGAGPDTHTKGTSGTNNPSSETPQAHTPSTSTGGTGDPPAGGPNQDTPVNPNPPAQQQSEDSPGNQQPSSPNDGDHAGAPGGGPGTPGDPGAPGGDPGDSSWTPIGGDLPSHPTNPPGEVHSVPEPATLGLLGFGIVAAAALRRRRRS
jgi:hypothetical protein